jgi:hypothetical protein
MEWIVWIWAGLKELGKIGPLVTAIVALMALIVARRQLSLNRKNQRETTATATFREFLKLAVQYPDYANGKHGSEPDQKERYQWFVGYFLWAAEEILSFSPNDDVWHSNLQLLAKVHGPYFLSDDFTLEEYNAYTPAARMLIDHAKSIAGQSPPEVEEPQATAMERVKESFESGRQLSRPS